VNGLIKGAPKALKIIHITSNYRQSANQRGGSNERIFKMVIMIMLHCVKPSVSVTGF
jgi:hypothetical protein